MKDNKPLIRLGLLALVLLVLAGCSRRPPGEATPVSVTSVPQQTPVATTARTEPPAARVTTPAATSTPTATVIPASAPITEADVDAAMEVVQQFLAGLAQGEFRTVYGTLITTDGQQQLADLVLGRLALSNPHISYFEVLGAEPVDDQVAVDVVWEETYDGQGPVGSQRARILLARQDDALLVDDLELDEYQPAATPVPPPLPKAEALTSPGLAGQELQFRASGFQSGETVLAWLELPDGQALTPSFQTTDESGALELAYPGTVTDGLPAGRWIWWAQALRDSARNTGITFEVQAAPTAVPTPTQAPTRPRPTATPAPVAAQPTPAETAAPAETAVPVETAAPAAPTSVPAPQPSGGYAAPSILWPELETSRDYGSSLVVEFVPVADDLGPDEYYQLVLEARDLAGGIYNAGSVLGRGGPCSGQYAQPCRSITGTERFMELFHLQGVDGRGTYYIQVVRQTGPDQYTTISPPSDPRVVILKPRPDEG